MIGVLWNFDIMGDCDFYGLKGGRWENVSLYSNIVIIFMILKLKVLILVGWGF